MASRIVIEEECEHDELSRHFVWLYVPDAYWCPGGSRRVLDPGSFVLIEKVDGEWPEWVAEELHGWAALPSMVVASDILDALAGGES